MIKVFIDTDFHGKKNRKVKINAKISSGVKDYGNDPFFIKKANESKTFLEKHGFPEELLNTIPKTLSPAPVATGRSS
jgi:hypothetical protein